MVKTLIIFSLFSLLLGCQSFIPNADKAANITAKAVYVDELVKSGAIVDSLLSSNLSQADIDAVQTSLKAYNNFTAKWGGVIQKNPLDAITHTSLIISEYNVLRIRYAEIERIVAVNWDGYTPENQFLLMEYRSQAKNLDALVMNLLSQSKTNTALIAVQKLAVVAGQIALKLI